MMKEIVVAALAAIALAGCTTVRGIYDPNPYNRPLFYEKYLTKTELVDARISQTIVALRDNPTSATLHNELGQLLRVKGFPKDAEVEFERAINADSKFYPAWYNLGLLRQARGNHAGARFAFGRTIRHKPGHAEALFQMGLIEEQRHNTDAAIDLYAKAFSINRALLDVRVNPRLVDTKLTHRALLKLYPTEHARQSMDFQGTPQGYAPAPPQAPSPQPTAPEIVTPSAPVTDPSQQPPPVKPPL